MRNEQLLRQIRPVLELDTRKSGPDEIFQNQTLRPILKMQHALLMAVFRHAIRKRYESFLKMPLPNRLEVISNSIRSDLRLRNLMTGLVIGQFTLDEYEDFITGEAEHSRRLADLLVQRIQSDEASI